MMRPPVVLPSVSRLGAVRGRGAHACDRKIRSGALISSNVMAIQWSGLGPELLLRLDRGSGQPLRSQLEAGLREAIRSGRLNGGERLPSSRELARELGVSRGLVQECYSQLLSEGYLTSQIGSATRVAAGAYPAPPVQPPQRPEPRAPADRGLPRGSPRPGELSARRLGVGDSGGMRQRVHPGSRLRRSARQRRPAPRARRVPAAGARRRRRSRADDREHRIRAGTHPGAAGTGPGGRPVRRLRGSRLRERRDR